MARANPLRTPLLWTAYVVLPVGGWGLLHGAPTGLFGAAVLCAIWWTWWFSGPLPGQRILALLGAANQRRPARCLRIDHGLGSFDSLANPQWAPPVEHSTEFPWPLIYADRSPSLRPSGKALRLPAISFFKRASRFNYRPGEARSRDAAIL